MGGPEEAVIEPPAVTNYTIKNIKALAMLMQPEGTFMFTYEGTRRTFAPYVGVGCIIKEAK